MMSINAKDTIADAANSETIMADSVNNAGERNLLPHSQRETTPQLPTRAATSDFVTCKGSKVHSGVVVYVLTLAETTLQNDK